MSNGETALGYAMSLAHATSGSGLRRTSEQIIDEARKYRDFLDESAAFEDPYLSVWVLTSQTYKMDAPEGADPADTDLIVGIYASEKAAESYRDNAIPPVTDGVITEWGVHELVVGPDAEYLPIGEGA